MGIIAIAFVNQREKYADFYQKIICSHQTLDGYVTKQK